MLICAAIKQHMEKDVDEVGKIARFIKSKIEELDKEVRIRAYASYLFIFISFLLKTIESITLPFNHQIELGK